MAPCFQRTKTEPQKNARNKNQSTASTAVHPEVLLGIIISLIVNCTLVWHLKDTKINHILLMVQKSGDHQLRLEVFFPLFSGVFIPSKRWLAGFQPSTVSQIISEIGQWGSDSPCPGLIGFIDRRNGMKYKKRKSRKTPICTTAFFWCSVVGPRCFNLICWSKKS